MIKIGNKYYPEDAIINRYVSIKELLDRIEWEVMPYNNSLRCPFHSDVHPSAKLKCDEDGDKIWCFTCGRQFKSMDLIKEYPQLNLKGILMEIVPHLAKMEINLNPKNKMNEKVDVSFLDGFKKGEFGIETFLKLLCAKFKVEV